MSYKRNAIKWERAKLMKRRDNIIGSPQFKDLPAFNVSYEMDKEVNMNYLLSWKYGRVWCKEFVIWDAKYFIEADKNIYRRKYVLRALKKIKPKK